MRRRMESNHYFPSFQGQEQRTRAGLRVREPVAVGHGLASHADGVTSRRVTKGR